MFGWYFGSVSCFGSNLDSEFTFLLPAGRSECFFQTAIKNGTMEVEYQVTAKVFRKQTLTICHLYVFLSVTHSKPLKDAWCWVHIMFSAYYSDGNTLKLCPPPPASDGKITIQEVH